MKTMISNESYDLRRSTKNLNNMTKEKIISIISNILHAEKEQIFTDIEFIDLGVDSISGVEIIREINSFFNLNLNAVELYDYTTVNSLAKYVDEKNHGYNKDDLFMKNTTIQKPHFRVETSPNRCSDKDIPKKQNIVEHMMDNIHEKIIDLICDSFVLEKNQINPLKKFADLGIDYIDSVKIVRAINHMFSLNLRDMDIYKFKTIEDLCFYISEKTKSPKKETTKHQYEKSKISTFSSAKNELLSQTMKIVLNTLGEILHLEPDRIDKNIQFIDLGLDSVGGVEFIKNINNLLELNIEAVVLYDYPTVEKFVNFLLPQILPNNPINSINKTNKKKFIENNTSVIEQTKQNKKNNLLLKPVMTRSGRNKSEKEVNPRLKKQISLRILDMKDKKESRETSKSNDLKFDYLKKIKLNNNHQVDKKIKIDKYSDQKTIDDQQYIKTDVAIVGMSGRFPKSHNLEQLWNNLINGRSCITEVPKDKWNIDQFYNKDRNVPKKSYSKWMGVVSDIDKFDPLFFNISPAEAELMDPQQRLFLEESWKALEDSGYDPKSFSGNKCSVFVGCGIGDYSKKYEYTADGLNAYTMMGSFSSILSARISYFLNLIGPCVVVDTACSSSLVAVHHAYQSIVSGENDLSIAAGVHLQTSADIHIMTSKAGMLSSDEKCRTFDNSADGFVLGEGVGVIVLKPLNKAMKDNDHIYGIIKGSCINQDGKTNGITAPSARSQTLVQTNVYDKYKINPENISYVEAHGAATKLGDPIEFKALKESFSKYCSKKQYCAIGSIKSNIGHCAAVAGISGLIKIMLCLENKTLVPSISFQMENEHIRFIDSPFYLNTQTREWKAINDHPIQAAINSFGFSGTNCHMVVEQAPERSRKVYPEAPFYLIQLSAKTKKSLSLKLIEFKHWLTTQGTKHELNDIAYTLSLGRTHFPIRVSFISRDVEELKIKISKVVASEEVYIESYYGDSKEAATKNEKDIEELGNLLLKELKHSDIGKIEYKKKLVFLKDLYEKGYNLNWENLYKGQNNFRINLPTYMFEKNRYWIEKPEKLSKLIKKNNSTLIDESPIGRNSNNSIHMKNSENKEYIGSEKLSEEVVYFKNIWEKDNLENIFLKKNQDGDILIFDISKNLSEAIQKKLKDLPIKIVTVEPGNEFRKSSDQSYKIKPDSNNDYNLLLDDLETSGFKMSKIIFLWTKIDTDNFENSTYSSLQKGLYPVFRITSSLVRKNVYSNIKMIYVFFEQDPVHSAMAAFNKSIRHEKPDYSFKNVHIISQKVLGRTDYNEQLSDILLNEFCSNNGYEVLYKDGQRYVRHLKALEKGYEYEKSDNPITFKENGVYLITGGAGGLGLIFSEYLIKQKKINLIIAGRSKLCPSINSKIKSIESLGAKVDYHSADIANSTEVNDLIQTIKDRFKKIDGIIHCAGISKDSLVHKKTINDINQVLAPKIFGTKNLDLATKNENLDFFIIFSSWASVLGNIGQCDYAFANSYMDNFTDFREQLVKNGKRFGKTISINWPVWKEGGIKPDPASLQMMKTILGIVPLSRHNGINAFEKALASVDSRIIVAQMERSKILQNYEIVSNHLHKKSQIKKNIPSSDQPDDKILLNNVISDTCNIVSSMLKIEVEKIDIKTELNEYGFDSIKYTELANKINQKYSIIILPPVFFEHRKIIDFVEFFIDKYRKHLTDYYKIKPKRRQDNEYEEINVLKQSNINDEIEQTGRVENESKIENNLDNSNIHHSQVAIVGISGVMPMSDDLNTFWKNLVEGTDMISDIPKSRVKNGGYFGFSGIDEEYKRFAQKAGFLNEIDKFDASFFKISSREAEFMDPQQKIMLEIAWQAIEDAGHKVSDLSGTNTGVFIGVSTADYKYFLDSSDIEIESLAITGNSNSITSNRISYLLNLMGPSESVDTACSSSLVAIKKAVDSIRFGNCDMAIAGGVNVIASTQGAVGLGKAGILSIDGKCKTFDKNANGYVRSEGAGAVLLKPLDRAIKDRNHIYAVIKAATQNHGGRANTLTSPNPEAQSELILKALKEANLEPSDISYIETHGTGTSLGDPIEINGLKKVYSKYYEKRKTPEKKYYCGLGAVKTNIGHLEAAAGIAGIIKILLSIKNKIIPKNINFNEINPYIDLNNSPFYLINKNIKWERLTDSEGNDLPRRAAMSSFGFGGANAHVILEEYIDHSESKQYNDSKPEVIVISAKTPNALKDYVKKLYFFLKQKSQYDKINSEKLKNLEVIQLRDVAFTLQNGRDEMSCRVAIIALDLEDLIRKLELFYNGKTNTDQVYYKEKSTNIEEYDFLFEDKEGEEFIRSIIERNKLDKLCHLWVSGVKIDWISMCKRRYGKRVSLPTYPFEKKRHWFTPSTKKNISSTNDHKMLHPLVMENTSTLDEQRFTSNFNGDEFFLKDHVVDKSVIMPGVASIEMARAAAQYSVDNSTVNMIENITWAEPIKVRDKNLKTVISLFPRDELVEFEISDQLNQNEKRKVNCSGTIILTDKKENKNKLLNIEEIKARCIHKKNREECYKIFNKVGINYGTAFQVIDTIFFNETEALSKIELPQKADLYKNDFFLHPSIMDGGLQTIAGFIGDKQMDNNDLQVPFALERVTIYKPLSGNCFAHMTLNKNTSQGDENIKKYNITYINEKGEILVKMINFSARPFAKKAVTKKAWNDVLYVKPIFEKSSPLKIDHDIDSFDTLLVFDTGDNIVEVLRKKIGSPKIANIIRIVSGVEYKKTNRYEYIVNPSQQNDYERLILSIINDGFNPSKIIHTWSADGSGKNRESIKDGIDNILFPLLYITQSLMKQKIKGNIRLIHLYWDDPETTYTVNSALEGFVKSVFLENPNYIFKTIELPLSINSYLKDNTKDFIETVYKELNERDPLSQIIKYSEKTRKIKKLIPFTLKSDDYKKRIANNPPFRTNGVYIITGGTGGLGKIVGQFLAKKYKAKLVLSSRSEMNNNIKVLIEKIEKNGGESIYVKSDISHLSEVQQLFSIAKKKFGKINGIIHCAGIIKDSLITTKKTNEVESVLKSKIYGTLNIDIVTKNESIDFFVLFSSSAAVTGNIGQSDYSFANSFMDNFAIKRNKMAKAKLRFGNTVSINWPLWKDGQMTVDENTKTWFKEQIGAVELDTTLGMETIEAAINSNVSQFVVLKGNKERILKAIAKDSAVINSSKDTQKVNLSDNQYNQIKVNLEKHLKQVFSDYLKINVSSILADKDFEEFGINSISFIEIAREIERDIVKIPVTAIYESGNIEALSNYMLDNNLDKVTTRFL